MSNIVKLYGVIDSSSLVFFYQEFYAGGSLFFHLRKKSNFDQDTTKKIVGKMVGAIDALHRDKKIILGIVDSLQNSSLSMSSLMSWENRISISSTSISFIRFNLSMFLSRASNTFVSHQFISPGNSFKPTNRYRPRLLVFGNHDL